MLGQEFRKLRQSKNISLNKACEGITSKSSLQRWENGQGEMSYNNVLRLLKRIHIQPKEFLDIAQPSELNSYVKPFEEAVKNNDIKKLKNLADLYLKLHYQSNDSRKLLFQAAIACNYYMDFTNINLMNENDILRLKAYFVPIEIWTRENVFFFGNTLLLLPQNDVYEISRSLFSYVMYHTQPDRTYSMSITTLINAVFVLVKKQEFNNAYSLFKRIKTLKLSEKLLMEKIKINYLETFFYYLRTKDASVMDKFLTNLEGIGLGEQAKGLKLGFAQFKEIMNKDKN